MVTDAMGRGMLIFSAARPQGPWSDGTAVNGEVAFSDFRYSGVES